MPSLPNAHSSHESSPPQALCRARQAMPNPKPPPPGSLGELKWDGASGCYFLIDPKQDFFVVLLEQTPSERQRIQRSLKLLVYEALEN